MHPKLYVKRKENGLKQSEVAKKINICERSYNLKENGKRDFNITEMKRLAIVFNCTLDDLFWE